MTKSKAEAVNLQIEPISHKGKAKNARHHSFVNVSQNGRPWRTAYGGWRSVADIRTILANRQEFLAACDAADALAAADNGPTSTETVTAGDVDIDAMIRQRVTAMLGGADPVALLAAAKPESDSTKPRADAIAGARRRAANGAR